MILQRTMGIAQIPIEAFGSVSVSDFVCFRLLQNSAALQHYMNDLSGCAGETLDFRLKD